MKKIMSLVLALVMALGLVACGGSSGDSGSTPAPSAPAQTETPAASSTPAAPAASDRPSWAKGEDEVTGVLTVYTTMDQSQQDILLDEWSKLYPNCEVDIVADSVGTLATKIRSDETSGADVVIGGMFAADGDRYHDILQPYTATNDAEQAYHDPAGYYTFYDVQVMCLVVNPNVLKDLGVEVKGYKDLLQPELKGKIITADPAASSSGWRQLQTMLAVMGDSFEDAKSWEYIEQLLPQVFSTNSSKDVYNLVDQGEYAVGLSYESTPAGLIAQGGTTMQLVYMEEGNTAMPGGAAIVKDAPNLTAAQAMIDLLASSNFQQRRAELAGRGSNSNVALQGLPADSELGIVDLDYNYLATNKDQIIEHYNDIMTRVGNQ